MRKPSFARRIAVVNEQGVVALRPGVLSSCCVDLGLSREALSREMGISPTTLYRLERGDVQPSARVIGLLLTATGRAFEEIFVIDADT